MKKLPKICRGCVHAHPTYGNHDKTGKRIISSYFCSAKHAGLKTEESILVRSSAMIDEKVGDISCLLKPSPF